MMLLLLQFVVSYKAGEWRLEKPLKIEGIGI
jgi:hypothetical protein